MESTETQLSSEVCNTYNKLSRSHSPGKNNDGAGETAKQLRAKTAFPDRPEFSSQNPLKAAHNYL